MGNPVLLSPWQPLRFPSPTSWLFRLSENWDSGDLKAWFALKEYQFKFSLVEEQTAQITRVSLLGGGYWSHPVAQPWRSFYLWTSGPCWRLELLVLEERMQAKGRRHSSSQLIGCSVTTRKRRRGGATKQLMECVTRECVYIQKGWGLGRPCQRVLQDQGCFQGVRRGEEHLTC